MQAFTIQTNGVKEGIDVQNNPYPHIGVGEEGRGRRYVRFPVIPDLAHSLKDGCLHRASIIKTRKKGTLLAVPEKDPDKRALVLLDIEMGYRGGVYYTTAQRQVIHCYSEASHFTFPYTCGACGAEYKKEGDLFIHPESTSLAYITFGGNIDKDEGRWEFHEKAAIKAAIPQILAQGKHAQGLAGRMGVGNNYLVIMNPGDTIRAVRTGRLYGATAEMFIHWDGQEMKMGKKDEIFSPFEETEGETV